MKATLTYHSIDDSGSPVSLSTRAFAAHVEWLASRRVKVVTLDELVTHPDEGEDAVAVTFEDGFLNTRGPIEMLLDVGIRPTTFIVSGQVGKSNAWGGRDHPGIPTLPLLGWTELERLTAHGALVGAHTRTHPALTRLSNHELDDELLGSRDDLEARFGVAPVHISYPYGDVDDAVAARAACYFKWGHAAGFEFMRATDEATRLPRLDMYYFSAPGALESWGTARFARRVAWCRLRRKIRARLFGEWRPADR